LAEERKGGEKTELVVRLPGFAERDEGNLDLRTVQQDPFA
jgi:hypothetical protein